MGESERGRERERQTERERDRAKDTAVIPGIPRIFRAAQASTTAIPVLRHAIRVYLLVLLSRSYIITLHKVYSISSGHSVRPMLLRVDDIAPEKC